MEKHIHQILENANLAPSGENSQPWRFVIQGNAIYQYNLPERDQSLYNWAQRGSLAAHGAALENMHITAAHLGYRLDTRLFPDQNDRSLVAIIEPVRESPREEALYPFIAKRVSNRKPYAPRPLSEVERTELYTLQHAIPGVTFTFTEDPQKIKMLGYVGSVNEYVMLQNRMLHQFFFNHINWNKKEDEEKHLGFYIKTLELSPPAEAMFKLIRHWSVMRMVNKIGFAKMVAKQNAQIYSTSSAMGIITIPAIGEINYLTAGRLLERVWLTVAKCGLSLQPLTGVLFFMLKIKAGETESFSSEHIKIIEDAYNKVRDAFNLTSETVALMFRIGYGGEPSARSSRIPLEKIVRSR